MKYKTELWIAFCIVVILAVITFTSAMIAGNEARKGVYQDAAAKQIENYFNKVCPGAGYRFLESTTTKMTVECLGEDQKPVNFISYIN